jgi:hypothetical protein
MTYRNRDKSSQVGLFFLCTFWFVFSLSLPLSRLGMESLLMLGSVLLFFLNFFFFFGRGIWIWSLMLARQVLCHLNHTLSLFCFSYFSGSVLYFLP